MYAQAYCLISTTAGFAARPSVEAVSNLPAGNFNQYFLIVCGLRNLAGFVILLGIEALQGRVKL